MSKITDAAFTFCKVRFKKRVSREKNICKYGFLFVFLCYSKNANIVNTIWLFVLIVFSHRPLFELNISLD